MDLTREEKLDQLEKLLQSRILHGSGNLKAFLQYVVLKTIDDRKSYLKEYTIATEVFGRDSNSYDPRNDSVVRVQAGRLRTKLQEYYATEGKDDRVRIDLPKGQYAPVFSYAQPANGATAAADVEYKAPSRTVAAGVTRLIGKSRAKKLIFAGVAAVSLAIIVFALSYFIAALREKPPSLPAAAESVEAKEAALLWEDFLRSPGPALVAFSNTMFQGTAETGMKLLKPLDSPEQEAVSPVAPQAQSAAEKNNPAVTEHYTGVGEVMGVYFLGDLFYRTAHSIRVKRSLLLTWDDLKTENIVVLGSPAENFLLRDLPQQQDFVFRLVKDSKQETVLGLVNTKPGAGEQPIYLAEQEGPSRSQISEDYALISFLRGLDSKNRLMILAGITTFGTQAAAEYVTKPEYIKELIAHLNISPPGEPPRLPSSYQALVKVKVNGGVPVKISYVTHHILD